MDRNAQFEYINKKKGSFLTDRQPVISVDTKKTELVADSDAIRPVIPV
jgi:Rhodopirellula transposase DDE domain